jgi:hypothetical protein
LPGVAKGVPQFVGSVKLSVIIWAGDIWANETANPSVASKRDRCRHQQGRLESARLTHCPTPQELIPVSCLLDVSVVVGKCLSMRFVLADLLAIFINSVITLRSAQDMGTTILARVNSYFSVAMRLCIRISNAAEFFVQKTFGSRLP